MTTQRQLNNFAVNTFLYRTKLKMSKYKLAQITGLSQATITRIENGERQPSLQTAIEISRKLDQDLMVMLDDPRE